MANIIQFSTFELKQWHQTGGCNHQMLLSVQAVLETVAIITHDKKKNESHQGK